MLENTYDDQIKQEENLEEEEQLQGEFENLEAKKHELLEQIKAEQQTLNLSKIKDLLNSLEELKQKTPVKKAFVPAPNVAPNQPLKEQQSEKPLTLFEARQALQYQILKDYIDTLPKEDKGSFIDSQINLDEQIKLRLSANLKSGD